MAISEHDFYKSKFLACSLAIYFSIVFNVSTVYLHTKSPREGEIYLIHMDLLIGFVAIEDLNH